MWRRACNGRDGEGRGEVGVETGHGAGVVDGRIFVGVWGRVGVRGGAEKSEATGFQLVTILIDCVEAPLHVFALVVSYCLRAVMRRRAIAVGCLIRSVSAYDISVSVCLCAIFVA